MNLDKKKLEALSLLSADDLALVIRQQTINIIDLLLSDSSNNFELLKASNIHKDVSEFMISNDYHDKLVYGVVSGLFYALGISNEKSINYVLHNLSFNSKDMSNDDIVNELVEKKIREHNYIIDGVAFDSVFDYIEADAKAQAEAIERCELDLFFMKDDDAVDDDLKASNISKLNDLINLLKWYKIEVKE